MILGRLRARWGRRRNGDPHAAVKEATDRVDEALGSVTDVRKHFEREIETARRLRGRTPDDEEAA